MLWNRLKGSSVRRIAALAWVLVLSPAFADQPPALALQVGHSTYVNDIAVSPDGDLLATAADDGVIVLWRVPGAHYAGNATVLRRLSEHGRPVLAIEFMPGGLELVSVSADRTLRLWDVRTGRVLHTLVHDFPTIERLDRIFGAGEMTEFAKKVKPALAVSGNGNRVYLSDADGAWAWDLTSNSRRKIGPGLPVLRPVSAIALSPNGAGVATGEKGNVSTWHTSNGERFGKPYKTKAMVTSLAYSSDGVELLVGDESGALTVVDSRTGSVLRRICCHEDRIADARFAGGGRIIVASSRDSLRIWSSSGTLLRKVLPRQQLFGRLEVTSRDDLIVLWGNTAVVGWPSRLVTGRTLHRSDEVEVTSLIRHIFFQPATLNDEFHASANGRRAASATSSTVEVWDMHTAQSVASLPYSEDRYGRITKIALDDDGSRLMAGTDRGSLILFDVNSGQQAATLRAAEARIESLVWAGKGAVVAASGKMLTRWDLPSGRVAREDFQGEVRNLAHGPKKSLLAFSVDSRLYVRSLSSTEKITDCFWRHRGCFSITDAAFSPDESIIATAGGQLWLWNSETLKGTFLANASIESLYTDVQFSPDGRLLAASTFGRLEIWDVASASRLRSIDTESVYVEGSSFLEGGDYIWIGMPQIGVNELREISGRPVATRITTPDNISGSPGWTLVLPDGRFDADSLEREGTVGWTMPDDPFNLLSVELFMREYYEPRLLERVLAGEQLPDLPALSGVNRAQPRVEITRVALDPCAPQPCVPDTASVEVTVTSTQKQIATANGLRTFESGAYDLRVFRDGQLVRSAPPILVPWGEGASGRAADLRSWRAATAFMLDAQGQARFDFSGITLPSASTVGEVTFSAYAFNSDRVKSPTARAQPLKVPAQLNRRPRAYVVAIGMNDYQNPAWNLSYAAADARLIAEELAASLGRTQKFSPSDVIPVPLISDAKSIAAGNTEISKHTMKSVLDLLAGKNVAESERALIPNGHLLRKSTPDDFVIIAYSGHGLGDGDGEFHLFPYDIGPGKAREVNDGLFERTLSSAELALWLRDIDAADMVLVVDACNSAASVEGASGFKPGPMGSRGFGQLAYDKQMRVLAASQSEDIAIESSLLRHGLLTFALVREGLEAESADRYPRDGSILLDEWLLYGADRVPALYGEITGSGLQSPIQAKGVLGAGGMTPAGTIQRPGLFDYAQRRGDVVIRQSSN